jgi:alpha-glucosidase
MTWLPSAPDTLAYTRGDGFACVVNMSGSPIELPEYQTCLLASSPLDGALLPRDTAVWLRLPTQG